MMERRVDVDILYKGGPMGTPVAGLDTVTGVINNFPRGEEIKTVLSRAPQTGPQPPNDSGMRNRDLSILITPTLHEVGGPPDPHQVPPNVVPAVP